MTAVTATFEFSVEFELDPDTTRLVRTFGFFWLPGFAAMTASLLVGATSLVARRSRFLPAWLSWAGFVITILLLFSLPLLFGAFAVALWVLATSIVLVVRRAKPEPSAA